MQQFQGAHGTLTGMSLMEEVTADARRTAHDQFEARVDAAITARRHVWAMIMVHVLDDEGARAMLPGSPDGMVIFDTHTLADSHLGCYVCEQELAPGLVGRPCPGDPG